MTSKSAKAIGSKNEGLVDWIISEDTTSGQCVINVIGPKLGSGNFKVSVEYSFNEVNGLSPRQAVKASADALSIAKVEFECKPVSVDLHNALEISDGKDISDMGAWVSLVYRDEDTDQIVANVVFLGEYAVVPIDNIKYVMGGEARPGRA
ncbi:MotB-like transcriptional regulator [Salmonella phage vB_SnwM_CGG4-1]|uniref:Uncharacterized protein n=1 Tax=Salmonella phage vB_SnwM_CGG4-1 TaxID=1815631 RepID=A0A1B0VVS1_9CAUD|nr:MotB-like transcriptional regulator [Salmonella phage vB_SnwM_CGG4-1]ANA49364.1 hypothetical protein CGG41_010 [Salmonella phage vB_SnwM_CGG4-1]